MPLPRGYISYNQIRTYQNCPLKYYFSYVKEIESCINDKILLGVVFHNTVEFCLKKKIEKAEVINEEALTVFNDQFEIQRQNSDIRWDAAPDKVKQRGYHFVKFFLHDLFPHIDPIMVEKELQAELPGKKLVVKGIIDLVEGDFVLSDFKTTTTKWSRHRIDYATLQMLIYKYLFEKTFGNVTSGLKFRIIYSKSPAKIKYQEISLKPEEEAMEKMLAIISFVADSILQGNFYKNESFMCGFCEYRDICRKHPG